MVEVTPSGRKVKFSEGRTTPFLIYIYICVWNEEKSGSLGVA